VKKNYQTNGASAMGLVVPEAVTVVVAELAGEVQEGLLAMAVGTGLQVRRLRKKAGSKGGKADAKS
jgi:putative transposase